MAVRQTVNWLNPKGLIFILIHLCSQLQLQLSLSDALLLVLVLVLVLVLLQ